jgi:copper chaperone CopZ
LREVEFCCRINKQPIARLELYGSGIIKWRLVSAFNGKRKRIMTTTTTEDGIVAASDNTKAKSSCSSKGKCSKSASTSTVCGSSKSNDVVVASEGVNGSVENSKAKSSCCSNGKCNKTNGSQTGAEDNSLITKDVTTAAVEENNKAKPSCCSKGKCSKSSSTSTTGSSSEVSDVVLVSNGIDGSVENSKSKSSCCSKGKCNKTNGSQTGAEDNSLIKKDVTTAAVEENTKAKPSCCSKGKCSSSLTKNASVRSKSTLATEEGQSKPKSACCSKGKCSKTGSSKTTGSTGNNVDVVTESIDDNSKPKSCCSKGVCSSTQNGNLNHDHKINPDSKPEASTETTTTVSVTSMTPTQTPTSIPQKSLSLSLCIAVVQENGTDVVVFDTNGVPRTFHFFYPQSNGNKLQLCFDSHGRNDMNGDTLSPCFNEYGLHGNPVDPCFCGVETAHLHAHIKNSTACTDKKFVASHILYPVEQEETVPLHSKQQDDDQVAFHLPASETMPSQCNSKEWSMHTNFFGNKHMRRLGFVRHDDHIDNLIHNTVTNQLHLQHSCNTCGNDDVHGRFRSAGKRRMRSSSSASKGPRFDIHVQFFEIDRTTPFKLLDYLSEIFDIHSDRVDAVDNIINRSSHHSQYNSQREGVNTIGNGHEKKYNHGSHNDTGGYDTKDDNKNYDTSSDDESFASGVGKDIAITNSTVVRSTFGCREICCASEIPIINRILSPMNGVNNVLINVPLKKVSVDHDVSLISAEQLAKALNIERMGATVERDGGAILLRSNAAISNTTNNTPNKVFSSLAEARSQFHVQNICCASEIPAINKILNAVSGVRSVKINTTTKMVFVDHDIDIVSAQGLSDALSYGGFGATIRQDAAVIVAAAANNNTTASEFLVQSKLQWNESINPESHKIRSYFQSMISSGLVQTYNINTQTRSIDITHNPLAITIVSLGEGLKDATYVDTVITRDGSDPVYWNFPISLDTKNRTESDELELSRKEANRFTYPRPTVIISGLLWLISLLSLLGGIL